MIAATKTWFEKQAFGVCEWWAQKLNIKLEQVRRLQWIGVVISFLGVSIFIGDKLLAGEPAAGDLLNVVAALCFAVYALATRPLVVRYGAETTTAWAVLIGLVAVIPFTFRAMRNENWSTITGFEWFSIAWAAIVSVIIGYSLWGWAITRTGAGGRYAVLPISGYETTTSAFVLAI